MFKTRTDHWSHLLFPSYTAKHAMLHSASHASAQQKLAEPKTLQGIVISAITPLLLQTSLAAALPVQ